MMSYGGGGVRVEGGEGIGGGSHPQEHTWLLVYHDPRPPKRDMIRDIIDGAGLAAAAPDWAYRRA